MEKLENEDRGFAELFKANPAFAFILKKQVIEDRKKAIDLTIQKTSEIYEQGQIAQDFMIIEDIKRITGEKSNDGYKIVDSVRNLKTKTAQEIFEKI